MLMCALLLPIAHETAGAARTRHSLRPLNSEVAKDPANLGRNAPREREDVCLLLENQISPSFRGAPLGASPESIVRQS
jgi:hypothetical protein